VTFRVTGGPVRCGDATYWKLIRSKNCALFITTCGYRLKLRITWSAPAAIGYAAYRLAQTYSS